MIIEGVRQRWDGYSARERALLATLGVVVLLVLIWLLIVQPVLDYRRDARMAYQEHLLDYAEAQLLLDRLSNQGAPAGDVRELFETAGLSPQITQSGTGIAASVAAARADRLMSVIARIEAEAGVRIASADLRTNGDNTLAADFELAAVE